MTRMYSYPPEPYSRCKKSIDTNSKGDEIVIQGEWCTGAQIRSPLLETSSSSSRQVNNVTLQLWPIEAFTGQLNYTVGT